MNSEKGKALVASLKEKRGQRAKKPLKKSIRAPELSDTQIVADHTQCSETPKDLIVQFTDRKDRVIHVLQDERLSQHVKPALVLLQGGKQD